VGEILWTGNLSSRGRKWSDNSNAIGPFTFTNDKSTEPSAASDHGSTLVEAKGLSSLATALPLF
jgi:hypothetical protein